MTRVALICTVPAASGASAPSVAFASVDVRCTVSVEETAFQFASTALTVTLNVVPVGCAVGVPVLPVAVPGAAVWPGARICNLANVPAFTWIAGLVLAVFVPSVTSLAVIVRLPAVFSVTLKVFVPAASDAFAGSVAFASVEAMCTVWVELTRFQLASTALTVTLKAVPAVCGSGVPVLPLAVPGAAVSPGTSS